MTKNQTSAIAGAFILSVLTIFGYRAQGATSPSQAGQSQPGAQSGHLPLSSSFDPSIKHLPPKFEGHSVRGVIDLIKKYQPKLVKDEFETSAAFDSRLESLQEQLPVVLRGGLIAFMEEPINLDMRYDADSGTATVMGWFGSRTIITSYKSGYGPASSRIVNLSCRTRDMGSYRATNAYGVSRTVKKTEASCEGFIYSGTHLYVQFAKEGMKYELPVELNFSIGPEDARSLKNNAMYLFLVRIEEPYFVKDERLADQVTLDSPYEHTIKSELLTVIPEQLWVLDRDTGRVAKKVNLATGEDIPVDPSDLRDPRAPMDRSDSII